MACPGGCCSAARVTSHGAAGVVFYGTSSSIFIFEWIGWNFSGAGSGGSGKAAGGCYGGPSALFEGRWMHMDGFGAKAYDGDSVAASLEVTMSRAPEFSLERSLDHAVFSNDTI